METVKVLLIFLVFQTVLQLTEARREKYKGDTYTEEELQTISKLKKRIDNDLHEHWMHDNKFYIRFLRARRMNVDAAEQMIREAVKWRKAEKMENILSEDFSWWERTFPFYIMHDYDGRPGIASGVGQMNFRKWVIARRAEEVMRYIYYGLERGTQYGVNYINETGIEYNHGNLLFNLAGFNIRNHICATCLPFWINLAKIYEGCYPLLGLRIIVINAPRLFVQGLSSVKPFVSQYTLSSLALYGFNKDEFKREILKIFPAENITPEFGGTLKLTRASSNIAKPKIDGSTAVVQRVQSGKNSDSLSAGRASGQNVGNSDKIRNSNNQNRRNSSTAVTKVVLHNISSTSAVNIGGNNAAEFHRVHNDGIVDISGLTILQKNLNSIIAGTNKGGVQSAVSYGLASIFGTQSYDNTSKPAIESGNSAKNPKNSTGTYINIGNNSQSNVHLRSVAVAIENIKSERNSTNSSAVTDTNVTGNDQKVNDTHTHENSGGDNTSKIPSTVIIDNVKNSSQAENRSIISGIKTENSSTVPVNTDLLDSKIEKSNTDKVNSANDDEISTNSSILVIDGDENARNSGIVEIRSPQMDFSKNASTEVVFDTNSTNSSTEMESNLNDGNSSIIA